MGYLYILKLLCTFAIELRNMFNQLDFLAMQEDLENEIERKKKGNRRLSPNREIHRSFTEGNRKET